MVFCVSGRMQGDVLHVFRDLLRQERTQVAIDLEEVSLVDREVVVFLGAIESSDIELRNCPTYIREWIDRESAE